MKSPDSVKSDKSYFSNAPSVPKTSYEAEPLIDQEALGRSLECREMLDLRAAQVEERNRFLEYQSSLITTVRAERDKAQAEKSETFKRKFAEQEEKVSLINRRFLDHADIRRLERQGC